MARSRWNPEICREKLLAFVDSTDDLATQSWEAFAKREGAPSAGTLAIHMGGPTFSDVVSEFAQANAVPDREYRWPLCPKGAHHGSLGPGSPSGWRGTAAQRAGGACERCIQVDEAVARWHAANPWVDYKCEGCGAVARWAPHFKEGPICARCRATGGKAPGELVERQGGGAEVVLEARLAAALREAGLDASHTLGVVVPAESYVVDVIKPDVVVPSMHVAVELDQERYPQHATPEGAADDRKRDRLLASLGWRVLRIRRPGMPIGEGWPWQVVTTSTSPKKLAALVVAEIEREVVPRPPD